MTRKIAFLIFTFSLLTSLLLSACGSSPGAIPTLDQTAIFDSAIQTATHAVQVPTLEPIAAATSTPEPPAQPAASPTIPLPTIDPNATPPALPDTFTTAMLNPLDTPHTYVADKCQYIKDKWTSTNAKPGTVVMPIMFHSIVDGPITQPDQIFIDDFKNLMRSLNDQGFIPIATQHLRDFMYHNAYIPERSVVLIVDDRKYAQYFTVFEPYYAEYGWKAPIVNAWISFEGTIAEVYEENIRIQNEGIVDHQAHGVVHNENITSASTEDYMRSELQGSMNTIEEKYGVRPIAYIWPGGGFTKRAVEIAREVGYELGFTINPRGPLMYNWIPLADADDPARPSFLADGSMGDPLLVLPRYWDSDALYHLDTVRQIGKEAAAAAEAGRGAEMDYYNLVCLPSYGPIP